VPLKFMLVVSMCGSCSNMENALLLESLDTALVTLVALTTTLTFELQIRGTVQLKSRASLSSAG